MRYRQSAGLLEKLAVAPSRSSRFPTILAPLRIPPFGRLLSSYTINELGDSIAVVALAVLVYDQTGDPLATTALFVAARFIPAFLAPVLTARLDQLALRRVLPAIYVIEAVSFIALALLAESFLLVAVLALALLDGTLAVTARGLSRSAVAAVLKPREELRRGNALINVGFAVSSVGGAALGGALVSVGSVQVALLVDAVTFAGAAIIIAGARDLPGESAEREPFGLRLREGLAYASRHPFVRLLYVAQALALVFFTLIVPIEVVYAKESLDAGDAGFGLLLASWGAGIVIGSLLFAAIHSRATIALVVLSSAAVGVAYLGMAAAGTLAVACALSVLGGAGNGVQWVSVMTLLQEHTPQDLQARAAGLLESVAAAMPGVGFVLGGVLTAVSSPRTAYAVAGGGVLVVVAIVPLVAWRSRRSFRDAQPVGSGR